MKKLLSIVLCLVFVFSFTACGDKKSEGELDVDVEYYAKLGQIADVDYTLGGDVDDAKKSLEADDNAKAEAAAEGEHVHAGFSEYPAGKYTVMSDGSVACCYETDKKNNGITHIVKYGDAYGFYQGAISTQVRDTMSDLGFDATERDAEKGELFFLPGSVGLTVLEYKIKDTAVLFVFAEHALSATVIY
ncbi:MAG: hypothetical protein Q4B40_00155 [Clostridia bacterium]|nr:hypothetical protein [Clostridia bacterium]